VLFLGGRVLAKWLSNGNMVDFDATRYPYVGKYAYIGRGSPLGIPIQVMIMLVVVATGGNEPAARLAGVSVARVKLAVYGIGGLLAGLAGLIAISRILAFDPYQVGNLVELDAIAVAAVGGTLLTGGRGSVRTTLVGVVLLGLIFNGLNFEQGKGTFTLRQYWEEIIRGAFLLLVVVLQRGHTRGRSAPARA
jgi:ribose transport system permease protein